jgi:IclR family transcriptional regulator, KDG regulon repressor
MISTLESDLATAMKAIKPARVAKRHQSGVFRGIETLVILLKARRSLGITQIATALNLPKSSAHDLVAGLCELNFVEQHAETRRYAISPKIFEFLHMFATEYDANPALKPILREEALKLKASVVVTAVRGRRTYALCASGPEADTFLVGDNGPAYSSACGRVLISQFDETVWADYAPSPDDRPRSPYCNLEPEHFYQQLREAKKCGVAWSVREREAHLCSAAAAIRSGARPWNRAVGIILKHREWAARDREEMAGETRALAERIAIQMGP